MKHTGSITRVLKAVMPVRHVDGAQLLRFKFQAILGALQLPAVSTTLATADFFLFYRALADQSQIELILTCSAQSVQIALLGNLQGADCFGVLQSNLVSFPSPEMGTRSDLQICISRSFPLSTTVDLDLLEEALSWQTPFESEVAAEAVQLRLLNTQDKLSVVQDDLKTAADIQQHMLLSKAQLREISPVLDCRACLVPSKDIGGDFYDVIQIDHDLFAAVVGDVSGKGVPASMMMATCSTLVRAYCETSRIPGQIVDKVNRRLCQGNDIDCMFTTLFLAIIDCKKSILSYCNAGHLPAVLSSDQGSTIQLAAIHGPALGVFSDHAYESDTIAFPQGSRLLLYTDGVTECFNTESELYGFERLHAYCSSNLPSARPARFLSGLLMDLTLFSATEYPHDDITLLSIRRLQASLNASASQHRLMAIVSEEGLQSLKGNVEAVANTLRLEQPVLATLLLVLDELVANLLTHASIGGIESTSSMILDISSDEAHLDVLFMDDSPAFNPLLMPEACVDVSLDDRAIGGLGLLLVRSLVEQISYSYDAPWNCIQFKLKLAPQ